MTEQRNEKKKEIIGYTGTYKVKFFFAVNIKFIISKRRYQKVRPPILRVVNIKFILISDAFSRNIHHVEKTKQFFKKYKTVKTFFIIFFYSSNEITVDNF